VRKDALVEGLHKETNKAIKVTFNEHNLCHFLHSVIPFAINARLHPLDHFVDRQKEKKANRELNTDNMVLWKMPKVLYGTYNHLISIYRNYNISKFIH
jgi:hypothetical protein